MEPYRAAHAGNPAAYASDLARVLNDLGRFLALDGRWEKALVPVVEAIALAERSAAANPPAYGAFLGLLRRTRDGCPRAPGRRPYGEGGGPAPEVRCGAAPFEPYEKNGISPR
nr:hypothetical protein [Streptomyces litmocidini]